MSTRTELGVWGFQHLVLYLCAIAERMHPDIGGTPREIIDAAKRIACANEPGRLGDCSQTLHSDTVCGVADLAVWEGLKNVVESIIRVVDHWYAYNNTCGKDRTVYNAASFEAKRAEQEATKFLRHEDLHRCAITVSEELRGEPFDANRRDAALAAMDIGHFDVAQDILAYEEDADEDQARARQA